MDQRLGPTPPRLANVPAPPISLELKEMGGAAIVPQRWAELSQSSPKKWAGLA